MRTLKSGADSKEDGIVGQASLRCILPHWALVMDQYKIKETFNFQQMRFCQIVSPGELRNKYSTLHYYRGLFETDTTEISQHFLFLRVEREGKVMFMKKVFQDFLITINS